MLFHKVFSEFLISFEPPFHPDGGGGQPGSHLKDGTRDPGDPMGQLMPHSNQGRVGMD